ncbi:MAG: DUF167 domain-containing protein [Dehalococcoidia bacterium]|nr:DUF167 domain-containing protein [Dehalococcoidia bacterium]
MKIRVDVKPNSKMPAVEVVEDHLVVRVKEPPKEGKANEAVLRAIAEHFGVPKREVRLVSGEAARHKVIEVPDR